MVERAGVGTHINKKIDKTSQIRMWSSQYLYIRDAAQHILIYHTVVNV